MVEGGEIEKEYSVRCGFPRCKVQMTLESVTKLNARSELRDRGWGKTDQHGWICSHHGDPVVESYRSIGSTGD